MQSILNKSITAENGEKTRYENAVLLTENWGSEIKLSKGAFEYDIGLNADQLSGRQTISGIPNQQLTVGINGTVKINIFSLLGFSKEETVDTTRKQWNTTLGMDLSRTMMFTQNLREDRYEPSIGNEWIFGEYTIDVNGTISFRDKRTHEYISAGDSADQVYCSNMSTTAVREKDRGYTFSIKYGEEVEWMRKCIAAFYPTSNPVFFWLEYEFQKNEYDYRETLSPEPYDSHTFSASVDMNVHENVKGGLTGKYILEKWYNRETKGLYRKIASYEFAAEIGVVF